MERLRWTCPLGPELEPAEAGGKAWPLGRLRAAGLPVPPGLVVPVSAWRAWLGGHPALAEALVALAPELRAWGAAAASAQPEALQGLPAATAAAAEALQPRWAEALQAPDPGLLAALREAWPGLAAQAGVAPEALRVAVRSSGVGEDGAEASSAGQALSLLGMASPEAAAWAVGQVWASAWSGHALSYRAFAGQAEPPQMAVLVQVLVDADASGVAFGADPASGERGVVLIDAAYGLGEGVVSGELRPDHVQADKASGAVRFQQAGHKPFAVVPRPEGGSMKLPLPPERQGQLCLNPKRVAQVVALVREAEAWQGGPVDLEWAFAGDCLWALQARPLTALPEPPPEGGWAPPVPDSLWERRNFAELVPGPMRPLGAGWLLPAIEAQLVGLARELGLRLPLPAIALVGGFVYTRSGAKPGLRALWRWPLVFGPLALRDPKAWALDPGGPPSARLGAWVRQAPEPQAASEAWVAWLEAYAEQLARSWREVHRASGGWRWSELLLQQLLGAQGPVGPWLAPARPDPVELALHEAAGALPEGLGQAVGALAGQGPQALALLEAQWPSGWPGAWARLQAAAAPCPHAYDPFVPLPFAQPEAAAAALAGHLAAGALDPTAQARARHAAGAEAFEAALASLPWAKAALARWLFPRARAHAAIRDEAVAALGLGWAEAVAGLEALGRALHREGRLRRLEQWPWHLWREARGMAGGLAGPSDALLAEREAAFAVAERRLPPAALGQAVAKGPSGHRHGLGGFGASPGRAIGRVRVIHGPEGFAALQAGEVLVAPATGPAWTPLFALACAVVTDEGGPLSHASIVARERGLPAVLGTGRATQALRDGQWVTVDGGLGAVWPGRHPA